MGCKHEFDNCVCDIVRRIADVQSDVVEHCCDVSCDKSIEALISPVGVNDLDTVPFMLYCEGTCQLFEGKGFMKDANGCLDCVDSKIFRVKKMVDECCAVLELLDAGPDECPVIDENSRTGICITVDLNCFCAITCLPAASTN